MLQTAAAVLLATAVAIIGGAGSVWYALKAGESFAAVTVGGWTAHPDAGTDAADPYTNARVALEGVLPLGRSEGLAFVAREDADGAPLRRDCAYSITGSFPAARFWTLYAADQSLAIVPSGRARLAALHSRSLLREEDNSVTVAVASAAQPGNWLPVSGAGAMSMVLTLYDTPLGAGTGLAETVMPRIVRTGCGA